MLHTLLYDLVYIFTALLAPQCTMTKQPHDTTELEPVLLGHGHKDGLVHSSRAAKASSDPTAWGRPMDQRGPKTYKYYNSCGFIWTGLHSSDRRQYDESPL